MSVFICIHIHNCQIKKYSPIKMCVKDELTKKKDAKVINKCLKIWSS